MQVQETFVVVRENLVAVGANGLHVLQVEPLCNFLLVDERFGEEHFCVDEDDRRRPVKDRNEVQEHYRFRSERRDQRGFANLRVAECMFQHSGGTVVFVAGVERIDSLLDSCFMRHLPCPPADKEWP